MSLATCSLVLAVAVLCPVSGYDEASRNNKNSVRVSNAEKQMLDVNVLTTRWKRSMAKALGEAAVKSLLKGAKQSIKKSEAFTKFVKRGNMDSAWKDFQSLNPTDVRKKKLGGGSAVYEAYIGDKRIILSAGDRTHRRQPHITVYDTNRVQSPMRIFYKRKIDSHYYDR